MRRETVRQRFRIPRFSKHPSSWKKYQSKLKIARWKKKALFVISYSLLFIGVFFGWKGWKFLTSPLRQGIGSTIAAPSWDGKSQINLLLFEVFENPEGFSHIQTLILASSDPTESTLKFLIIPPETLIITSKGAYPVSKIYALGAALNPPRQTEFLVKSVEKFLAVPIDGYVSVIGYRLSVIGSIEDVRKIHSEFQSPKFIFKIPATIKFIKSGVFTNLTPGQLFKVLRGSRGVRFDKLTVDKLNEDILSLRRLDTGEEVQIANQVLLDKKLKTLFVEEKIVRAGLKIQVLNGAEIPGLAGQAARFVENLGGEVLEIKNAEKSDYKNSEIIDYTEGLSRTIQRLEQIFGVKSKKQKVGEPQRADIVITVGRGFAGE